MKQNKMAASPSFSTGKGAPPASSRILANPKSEEISGL
jgi:hypothetical protein